MDKALKAYRWKERKARQHGLSIEAPMYEVWKTDVKNRVKDDDDCLMAITGKRRKGKSTAARKLAFELDPDFDIARQCCFSFEEVRNISEELNPGQVVIWDEIIEGGMAREWNTKGNKAMEKFFTISGDLNLIAIALAPHIDIFDPTLRRRFFTDWLLKPSRSTAILHTAATGGDYPGKERGWDQLCTLRCTPDTEANNEIYRQKKDDARRGIGMGESADMEFVLRAQKAAERFLKPLD